jgi:two-component system phosphate regulon sensor histidine kinase PhoR
LFTYNENRLIYFIGVVLLNLIFFIFFSFRVRRINKQVSEAIQKIIDKKDIESTDIKLDKSLAGFEEGLKKILINNKEIINNLKKVEMVRTEFLGNVSHELRTPIFAIQGFIETLLNGAIDDKSVNKIFLEKAFRHTENLNNLLNDLIDISMIESGKMRMSFRYFSVDDFLKNVISENKNEAEKKNLQIVSDFNLPGVMIYGDQNRLKQVMNNLIQNAIKYTDFGKIEITANEIGNKVCISISDTGIGIPPEDSDRIFERFYRVDKNRSREAGGTGLGLAIVKHILDAHGEKIMVESTLGIGTKFTFSLRK